MNSLCSLIKAKMRGDVRDNELMALHTSLKVGGRADCFVAPADLDDLVVVLAALRGGGIPYCVIGGGFNLLVRHGGIRGVVISLVHLAKLELDKKLLYAEAGIRNQTLTKQAAEAGLSGIEFLCGIPGTLGGALAMNAGAHGQAVLEKVETLTTLREGKLITRRQQELDFGYRLHRLMPGEIIISAAFSLEQREREEIEKRMAECLTHRRDHQKVTYPNAGSFFKNPPGEAAWKLIDAAGLRGCRVGGAQVSEIHTNFLVNTGGATAGDFLELATLIKTKVKETSGVSLEEEVRIIGED